ncbi:MAG TPA: hypothetical protein PK830_02435 [Candidatus Atribacteria bacterium]|nr:hypothetical protein [Candidatus Atribacteria bacterium]
MYIGRNVDRPWRKRAVLMGLLIIGMMIFMLLTGWARHTGSYFTYAASAETIVLYVGQQGPQTEQEALDGAGETP